MQFPKLVVCAFAITAFAADSGVWKVAPPPPASWQNGRVADLAAHRKAVMDRIGDRGVLILYAAEPRNYAGDVDWPYRQENDFFYLTGLTQPGATLVLAPGAGKIREMVFLPHADPARESWTGHMLTPAEAREISGIAAVYETAQWGGFLNALMPRARAALATTDPPADAPNWAEEFAKPIEYATDRELKLYLILPARPSAVDYRREQEFAGKIASVGTGITILDATSVFSDLRRVKSRRELDMLKQAVEITAEGFQRAYAIAAPGTPEYEIQAQFEFTFLRRNGHWGYPCIIGSGTNATTLHYESNKDTMKSGDLLLMDSASEFDGYSADVTRTIPVNGKYTRVQAEIYRLVWEAQRAGLQMAKPGHTPASIQTAANEVFQAGLYKLGLITDPKSYAQMRVWFNHGVGHGIGLNVHDPGGKELEPGMVVTVEPGLYFRPGALDNLPKTPEMAKFAEAVRPVFEKYKGIGVRIEDDVEITDGEPVVLSGGIPSKLEDVEAEMAKLRAAVKVSPLP
jgi:Xaa-Pro aminopeptidase